MRNGAVFDDPAATNAVVAARVRQAIGAADWPGAPAIAQWRIFYRKMKVGDMVVMYCVYNG